MWMVYGLKSARPYTLVIDHSQHSNISVYTLCNSQFCMLCIYTGSTHFHTLQKRPKSFVACILFIWVGVERKRNSSCSTSTSRHTCCLTHSHIHHTTWSYSSALTCYSCGILEEAIHSNCIWNIRKMAYRLDFEIVSQAWKGLGELSKSISL